MDDNFQGSHPTLMQTCHLAHVKKFRVLGNGTPQTAESSNWTLGKTMNYHAWEEFFALCPAELSDNHISTSELLK